MIHWDDLLAATGGRVVGTPVVQAFSGFCYDSRQAHPGELFVAVKTGHGDGHDYIDEALARGVTAVLCQSPPASCAVACLIVPDTQLALTDWAAHVLRKFAPEVVGITGSTGKTSTREAVAAVLGTRHGVFRNPANFNGSFGLPIALAGLQPAHDLAVLELASDAFGEIRCLAELTRPRIGVVTAVNHAHLAYLGSLEAIAEEKGALVEALPPDGLALLNYDDPRVRAMAARARCRVLTYGHSPDADLVASNVRPDREGLQVTVHFPGVQGLGLPGYPAKAEIRTRLIGRHHAYTLLAAIGVGLAYRVPWEQIVDALADLSPISGRLRVLRGLQGSTVLDDSYSASPASMLAALQALVDFPLGEPVQVGDGQRQPRRVAVLGDMAQLGGYAVAGHHEVGRAAAAVADVLVTRGERAAWIAEAAGHAHVTYTAEDTVRYLRSQLAPGDVVLVKGDIEARMELIVRELLADPADVVQLVRQEPGWEKVRSVHPARPTWVEVDLEAIAYNVRRLKEIVGPQVALLAVLKADAYGHGAVKVAQTAVNNGAACCGVASLNEATRLRQAGIEAPILVLGYTPAWLAREALVQDVTVTLYDRDVARAFSRAALDLHKTARVHVKVDSGMGRLGLLPDEALPFVLEVRDLPGLELEGVFTHFSVADEPSLDYTLWQHRRFVAVLDELCASGVVFRLVHAANSAATLRLPQTHHDMVRVGLALYGLSPSASTPLPPDFRRALSWKTTVAQVKTLPPHSLVGYGNAYETQQSETIAVIPVGYADGFRRAPRHWGEVLVRGQRAPIVGRVSMDQTMIGVSHIPHVRLGDEVVLIGAQDGAEITAEDVAGRLGTINYEVVSEILARVPRMV